MLAFLKKLGAILFAGSALCCAQAEGQAAPAAPQQTPEAGAPAYTFKAITRMIIVEVVARDSEDNPVRDLRAEDLRVTEKIGNSVGLPEKIASFNPVNTAAEKEATSGGIVLGWLHKSFCPLTGAYELSYYLSPESQKDGLHRISVTTSRRGLTLYFRPGYRILADKPAKIGPEEFAHQSHDTQFVAQQSLAAQLKQHPELELATIACYDTLDTTNFPVQVKESNPKKNEYEFTVPASYFASLPASSYSSPTQLDFSLCTFEPGGHPLRHFEGTAQAGTTSAHYRLISSQGFTYNLAVESPAPYPIEFSARLVVRDRATGAIGTGEVLLAGLGPDPFSAPIPEGQTNLIFGTSTKDSPLAMCGDVYQLVPWTVHLPRFSEIDAAAPIYTTSLGVYSRFFTLGIPGITGRTEWFGVNYQGVFGVDKQGKYEFDLLSDDGARVYIDDKLVVNDDTLHSPERSRTAVRLETGAHTIRISYFQGPRTEVALVLLVKPPGREWRLFDTRDFPTPDLQDFRRKKLPLPDADN